MSNQRKPRADVAATVALLVVITVVSIALAIGTDLDVFARLFIAVGAGLVAAIVTYIAVGRRRAQ
ncbi:hypothetical protein [Microcella alkalica]|uniref:hypothetical protein n=1 Tax=Microcella alkalica TaxID=355930 RepID=UPI00145D1016|nr:hypothetical protein [Microcella alkalica]